MPIDIINIDPFSTFSDVSAGSVLPVVENSNLMFVNNAVLNYYEKTVNLSKGISFVTKFRFLKNYPYQNLFYLGSLGTLDILCSQNSDGTKFRLFVRSMNNNSINYECIGGQIVYDGSYHDVAGIFDFSNRKMYLIVSRIVVKICDIPNLSGIETLSSSCVGCQSPQYPVIQNEKSSMNILYLRIYNRTFDLSEVSDAISIEPTGPTQEPTLTPTLIPTRAPTLPPITTPPVTACLPSTLNICSGVWNVYGYIMGVPLKTTSDNLSGNGRPISIDSSGRLIYSDNGPPAAFRIGQSELKDYVYMYPETNSLQRVYLKYNFLNDHVRCDKDWSGNQAYLKFIKTYNNNMFYIVAHATCTGSYCGDFNLKLDRFSNLLERAAYNVDNDYEPSIFRLVKIGN